MTNGSLATLRMRLKDITWSIKKLAAGTTKTYYYAWRGGPASTPNPGTPEFVRLTTRQFASHRKKSPSVSSDRLLKDQREYKGLATRASVPTTDPENSSS